MNEFYLKSNVFIGQCSKKDEEDISIFEEKPIKMN